MKKEDLNKKENLAQELGMKFDEAIELFSEETLNSMKLFSIDGGEGRGNPNCYFSVCNPELGSNDTCTFGYCTCSGPTSLPPTPTPGEIV